MVRPARLKQRRDFTKVAATRKKSVTPGFILQVRKRKRSVFDLYPRTTSHCSGDFPDLRVGFTVSKKVGNAVVRNRTKRRLRALVDQAVTEYDLHPGYDLVFIGRRETRHLSFVRLAKDMKRALVKTGVLATRPPVNEQKPQ